LHTHEQAQGLEDEPEVSATEESEEEDDAVARKMDRLETLGHPTSVDRETMWQQGTLSDFDYWWLKDMP
jgi:hypothetical protein